MSTGLALALFACASPDTPSAVLSPRDAVAAADSSIYPYITAHTAALPDLDDPSLSVAGINDFAEIVGTWSQYHSIPMAFKYQTTHGLTYMPHGTLSDETGANAVNDKGQVAVTGVGSDSSSSVGIWDWFGNLTYRRPLSVWSSLKGNYCVVGAINDQGVMGGACPNPSAPGLLATIWTAYGTPWALRTSGGELIRAAAAIDYTDSAYASGPSTDGTGFVLSPTGILRVVPELQVNAVAYPIVALAVNNHGQAAGTASNPDGTPCTYAIVSLSDHTVTNLGCGGMTGIDDDAIVVGTVSNVPVVWTQANGLQRLPGLEGGAAKNAETGTAVAINHKRQIIGTITMSTGVTHKVLWTLPSGPLASTLAVR